MKRADFASPPLGYCLMRRGGCAVREAMNSSFIFAVAPINDAGSRFRDAFEKWAWPSDASLSYVTLNADDVAQNSNDHNQNSILVSVFDCKFFTFFVNRFGHA